MTFPAYPDYKDSGVEWLGVVPEHWCSAPIKYMALERNSLFLDGDWIESKDISSDGIRYITTGNVGEGAYKEQGAGFISEETFHSLGCTDVYEGDVLISRLNNPIGRACITPDLGGRVVTSVDNVIFRPDAKYHKKFIVYLFSSEEYFKHTGNLARGATMQRISRGLLGNIRVVTPSLEEQTQIARFLDHETARIDALIEEQQRLIELLKEKRRGIALSALSDQTLPFVRIEHVVDVISRPVRQQEDESYTPIGLFNRDRGLFHKAPRETQDMGDSDFFWIKSGDLIISGQFAWEGAVAMAGEDEEDMVVSHRYPVLRGKHGVAITEYLYAILTTRHGDFLLNESSRGAAGRNRPLNLAALLKEKIRIPSREIQEHVRTLVQNEAEVLAKCREQIGYLQERRSALISAAVTGKIDVRGWQPPSDAQAPELVQEAV